MRLIGYLRVSGAGQIDAWGLPRQEKAIKTYAAANGHRIVDWKRDEGVSGTLDGLDRPGFAAAVARLGHGASGILAADLDRLARELTVQEAALAVIWRAGGSMFTATGGEVMRDDPNDPARTFVRKVMGLVIEYEKNQAVKRMRQGREMKAAEGKHAVGQYAFGYHGQGKGRTRDAAASPAEQVAVRLILERRKAGASFRAIAAELDASDLPPRRAAYWSPMAVRSVARRHGLA